MNQPLGNTRKIVVLVNAVAGKGRALRLLAVMRGHESLRAYDITYVVTDWPETIDDFSEAWIIGGDGTLNYFINKYPGAKIPLVIFKGGTGNDFAWKLYGDRSFQQQLEHVLEAPPQKVDLGLCNGKYFINTVGVGFDGEVLRSMKTVRFLGGHLGYLLVVIKTIFRFKEKMFRIKLAEEMQEGKFLLVTVSNSSRTGGGFHIAPTASVHDAQLDLVLCQPLSIWKRLRYLPVIEKGKHLSLPFIQHRQIENIHIDCGQIIDAQLDGELIESDLYNIKILPGHLQFRF
jgi:diacylglycerol kinase (ATP)